MGSLQILDLVVGVIFIYFLLSIICSTIVEMWHNMSKVRAEMLEDWIKETFNGTGITLGTQLLNNATVDGLTLKGRKPSYLPSGIFVRSLIDQIITHHRSERKSISVKPYNIEELKDAIEKTPLLKDSMKRLILQNIEELNYDLDKTRKSIEGWFDSAMERLGGTFKKRSQLRLFFIGLAVSLALNVDTVVLVRYFYQNPEAARQIADVAAHAAKDSALYKEHADLIKGIETDATTSDSVKSGYKEIVANISRNAIIVDSMRTIITGLEMPLGWQRDAVTHHWIKPTSFGGWLSKFFGILISGFALSMGGVFWFDLLNKLVNLRGVGTKPATSTENTKEEKDAVPAK